MRFKPVASLFNRLLPLFRLADGDLVEALEPCDASLSLGVGVRDLVDAPPVARDLVGVGNAANADGDALPLPNPLTRLTPGFVRPLAVLTDAETLDAGTSAGVSLSCAALASVGNT